MIIQYKEEKTLSLSIKEKDFEEIYQKTYLNTLKFITLRCYQIEDINDILQDTYVQFFKILRQKRNIDIEKSQAYIYGIAKFVIKRHYSKKKKEKISLCLVNTKQEESEIKDDFNLEETFMTKENAHTVFDYLKKKDLQTSQIFYLYFIFGMKIAEIAQELNLTQSNVKNRIYRTQKQLQQYFREEGMEDV